MPPDELANARAAAQAAMEDESHARARRDAAGLLAARREEAKRAMESREGRERREKAELAARQKIAALAGDLNEKQRAGMLAAKTRPNALNAQETDAQTKEQTLNRRIDEIGSATRVIDRLKDAAMLLSPLRTLKSDMARAVKEEGISVAKIAVAEQARRQAIKTPAGAAPASPRARSHRLAWLLFVLVALGSGAGGFWWWQERTPAPPAPTVSAPAPLIPSDATAEINTDEHATPSDLQAAIARAATPTGGQTDAWQIKQLYLTGGGRALDWPAAAAKLGVTLPDGLSRSLTGDWQLGAVRAGPSAERFILLQTNLYNNARAGLLDWESTLPTALGPILHNQKPSVPVRQFSDRLIRNKDARVIADETGQTVFFYVFLDNETILLTTGEAAFAEIYQAFVL